MINSNLLIARGTTAQLGIRTTGVGTLWYEWRKTGAGQLPAKVSGGDTELLTIPEVDISDEGNYSCTVTNTWKVTVVSADIILTTYGNLINTVQLVIFVGLIFMGLIFVVW